MSSEGPTERPTEGPTGGRSPDTGQWPRMYPADRPWVGGTAQRSLIGIIPPSREQIRANAHALVGARYSPLARMADLVALRETWTPPADAQWRVSQCLTFHEQRISHPDELWMMNQLPAGMPWRFDVGPNWVNLVFDHSFGDGLTIQQMTSYLMSPEPLDDLEFSRPSAWRRDATALTSLGKQPLKVAGMIRDQVRLRKQWAADLENTPTRTVSGPAQTESYWSSAPEGFLDELRALRDVEYEGASVATMTIAGLLVTMAEQLGEPVAPTEVYFNIRDHFPKDMTLMGNWAVGLLIDAQRHRTPQALATVLRQTSASPLPVLRMLASQLQGRLRKEYPKPDSYEAVARPGLRFSMMPRVTDSFTYDDGGLICDMARTVPTMHSQLFTVIIESGGSLHLTTSFDNTSYNHEQIAAAHQHFYTDPVTVLAATTAS